LAEIRRQKIHKLIRAEYNGYNITEMALKYGYSEAHIGVILNSTRGKSNQHNHLKDQLTLEDMF